MKFLRRLRYLLRQRQMERDLAEEIDFHNEMNGDSREMGNLTRSREDARAVWIWPWLQSVWQDLAYGFRNLRREPGFTLVADRPNPHYGCGGFFWTPRSRSASFCWSARD